MHYIYPSIGGAMFAFGFGSTTDISLTMVLDAFPLVSVLTACNKRIPNFSAVGWTNICCYYLFQMRY